MQLRSAFGFKFRQNTDYLLLFVGCNESSQSATEQTSQEQTSTGSDITNGQDEKTQDNSGIQDDTAEKQPGEGKERLNEDEPTQPGSMTREDEESGMRNSHCKLRGLPKCLTLTNNLFFLFSLLVLNYSRGGVGWGSGVSRGSWGIRFDGYF